MGKILVVDDERSVLAAFERMLATRGHDVIACTRAEQALARLELDLPDLVILDVYLPGMTGLEAFQRIHALRPRLPVIVTTGRGTPELAIEASKLGAFDYQLKPFDPEEFLCSVDRALDSGKMLETRSTLAPRPDGGFDRALIGQTAAMQEVYKAIGRVAPTDATVLIRGESGTGKELVARAIYQHSKRADGAFVAVNCVAIPETLLESELFGYERGAFTGATSRRIGKFEQASGGTIFLDEIGDIPLSIQAKILRVLQEKAFERIGGNETVRADVRVLAATNRALERAIEEGNLREDLYHRLNVVTIRIPPLRERMEDLPLLVRCFLSRSARKLRLEVPPFSQEAMTALLSHPWPGNVRELEHCIERAMIFSRGYPIHAADIRLALGVSMSEGVSESAAPADPKISELAADYLRCHRGPSAHEGCIQRVERALLVEALRRTKGNQSRAARLLGLARPTLHAKLQKHGLSPTGLPHPAR
jgi:two-component system NtrC family response regulator/two-component system nitrogen regulation response regulator GlnG